MSQDLIFFKREGEEGVALTSTSANHLANMAKEYIQGLETDLNEVSFLSINMSLIGGDSSCVQVGDTKNTLDIIPNILEDVAKAKSLIAWLREAIKAKEKIRVDIQNTSFDKWCEDNNINLKAPTLLDTLSESEYYASLSIKERNRYYQLETIAAVIGKYIHPDGKFSKERKNLKDRLQHPITVDGKGRDALIYTYTSEVEVSDVDETFFILQKRHREVQAQLNSMKHNCEVAIAESINKADTEYEIAIKEYNAKREELLHSFKTWKDTKTQECSKLKIIIPDSLMGIYNLINSLGK